MTQRQQSELQLKTLGKYHLVVAENYKNKVTDLLET